MSKIEVGATVYWILYNDEVRSGKVIAVKEKVGFDKTTQYAIDCGGSLSLESGKLFLSERDAYLDIAQSAQRDASRLLTKAADAFKKAGLQTEKAE